MRGVLVSAVVSAFLLAGFAGPSTTKRASVVPWDLYQEALRWQVMAPGVKVPERSYLLWCVDELTEEQLLHLAKAGYAVKGVAGSMVLVSGPITLYIDPKTGVDSLGFVVMMLPDVPLGVSLSTWPGDPRSFNELTVTAGIGYPVCLVGTTVECAVPY